MWEICGKLYKLNQAGAVLYDRVRFVQVEFMGISCWCFTCSRWVFLMCVIPTWSQPGATKSNLKILMWAKALIVNGETQHFVSFSQSKYWNAKTPHTSSSISDFMRIMVAYKCIGSDLFWFLEQVRVRQRACCIISKEAAFGRNPQLNIYTYT